MNLNNEFEPIRRWARERKLYDEGDIKTQVLKLQEEVGELAKAVLEKKDAETWDAIGDCIVVLTNIAAFSKMPIEECINQAFYQILNRKGVMFNGTFVKDKL